MSKNYCTYWFKGWWNECCCTHDKDYYKSGLSRKDSDFKLFKCVLFSLALRFTFIKNFLFLVLVVFMATVISLPVAVIMWLGVRIGGHWRYKRKQGNRDG